MVVAAGSQVAMDVILAIAVFSPVPILAVLCWIFYRAKKRDDEERARLMPPG